jgi:hypothetical protein
MAKNAPPPNTPLTLHDLLTHFEIISGKVIATINEGAKEAMAANDSAGALLCLQTANEVGNMQTDLRTRFERLLEITQNEAIMSPQAEVKRAAKAALDLQQQEEAKKVQNEAQRVAEEAKKAADLLAEQGRLENQRKKDEREMADQEREMKAWLTSTDELLGEPHEGDPYHALVKSAICRGRAIIDYRQLSKHYSLINAQIDLLFTAFNESNPTDSEFFGLNGARNHPIELWNSLSVAYQCLASAEACRIWLDDKPQIKPSQVSTLIFGMGAAESYLALLFFHYNMGVKDIQRETMRYGWLKDAAIDHQLTIPYWDKHGHISKLPVLEAAAVRFQTDFQGIRGGYEKAAATGRSMRALALFIQQPTTQDFEEQICALALAALNSGVPATHTDLIQVMGPYRDTIREVPALKPLYDAITRKMTLFAAKRGLDTEVAIEEVKDFQTMRMQESVQAYLLGKTVLIIGGNKVHETKKGLLKVALGCAVLDWPDTNEHTSAPQLYPNIERADMVLQLVKWSSNGMFGAMGYAHDIGKDRVKVTAGLGSNRIIFDVFTQVVGKAEDAAEAAKLEAAEFSDENQESRGEDRSRSGNGRKSAQATHQGRLDDRRGRCA